MRGVETHLQVVSARWSSGVEMIVYLNDSATLAQGENIAGILRKLPAVRRVDYIAKKDAMMRLRNSLGTRDDLLLGVENSMLPASLEVSLYPGVRQVASASEIVSRLSNSPKVDEVEIVGEWIDEFSLFGEMLRGLGTWLFFLVGFVCVFLVAVTMQTSSVRRFEEVRIYQLVGAGGFTARAPLFIEAALIGALGGALALAMAWSLNAVTPFYATWSELMGTRGETVFLSASDCGSIVLLGACLSVLGVWIGAFRRVAL